MSPDQQGTPNQTDTPTPTQPAWFTASVPADQAAGQPKPPTRRRLILLIIIGALIILAIIAGVFIITATKQTNATCLSNNDYYDLTGIKSADTLETTARFFTATITFKDSSTDYLSASFDNSAPELLARIAHFYSTHSNKSIVIDLSADYSAEADYDLTASRIQRISDDLVGLGVPDEAINTGIPQLVQPDDDSDTATSTPSVIVSVQSSSECLAN